MNERTWWPRFYEAQAKLRSEYGDPEEQIFGIQEMVVELKIPEVKKP